MRLFFLGALALACGAACAAPPRPYPVVKEVGALQDPAISESSGIAASRHDPTLFWTHNDSGDGSFLYALGPHGEKRGTFRLRGVGSVTDCEDIAADARYLYLGDIGDNHKRRAEIVVWRVPEPAVTPAARLSSQQNPMQTAPAVPLRAVYPDGPHNAETLLVHPRTGRLYVVAKNKDGADGVYEFPPYPSVSHAETLTRVGTVTISGEPDFYSNLVTGGDIRPDGRKLILRTYWNAYEFSVPPGPDFDAVWRTRPVVTALPLQPQGEGICYTFPRGDAVYLTSEGKGTTLYRLGRRP